MFNESSNVVEMSSKYRLIPTTEIATKVSIELNKQNVMHEIRVIPGKSGRNGWIEYLLHGNELELFGNDKVIPKILLRNSTDGSCALQIHIGFLRLVCSNGLIVGNSMYSDRVIHTKGPKVEHFLDQLPGRISKALDYITSGQLQREVEVATAVRLSLSEQLWTVVTLEENGVLSLEAAKDIRSSLVRGRHPEDTDTVWGVYNVINERLRRRGRSQTAHLEKNVGLLQQVIDATKTVAA